MQQGEPIKIGRIARPTERALGISLTGEVAIYVDEELVNSLAQRRPADYLSVLEEISSLIHDPDFVSFDEEKEMLVYQKNYYKQGAFESVYLIVKRRKRPIRWYLEAFCRGPRTCVPDKVERHNFVRPQLRAIPQKD